MRMNKTACTGLALALLLAFAPGVALAGKKNEDGSNNGNGIGKGGVPALRDRLLGLIDDLKDEIEDLEDAVEDLEDSLAETDARIDALEEDVADFDARLAAMESQFTDDDGDGFSEVQDDCDDENPDANPLETEVAGNGVDDDCDHFVDEA